MAEIREQSGPHRICLRSDPPPPQHAPQCRLDFRDSHLMRECDASPVAPVGQLPLLLVDELDPGHLPCLPAPLIPLQNRDRLIHWQG